MAKGPYQQTLGFILNDTARLLRKRFEQRARHLGLTRAQWQAIAYLARNEGIQQSALAEILEIEPITLGRTLDRLEAADLIERRRHVADRRVWLLHLKPKAHALMEDMFGIGDATRAEARSREARSGHAPAPPGMDLDEYPPKMFKEGGRGASIRVVPLSQNRGAGASMGNQCRPYRDGARIELVTEP